MVPNHLPDPSEILYENRLAGLTGDRCRETIFVHVTPHSIRVEEVLSNDSVVNDFVSPYDTSLRLT